MIKHFDYVLLLFATFLSIFVIGAYVGHEAEYAKTQQAYQLIGERNKDLIEQDNCIQKQKILINLNNGIIDALNKLYAGALVSNKKMTMTLTAYTLSPDECGADLTPALSTSVCKVDQTIAVSPDLRSWLGTFVYVEGFGVRYVNDLTSARFKNRVDILVSTKDEASVIGCGKANVYRFN